VTVTETFGSLSNREIQERVVDWLRENLPAGWIEAVDDGDGPTLEALRRQLDTTAFQVALGKSGYAAPTWPREYCGLSLSQEQSHAIKETLTRYRVPRTFDFVGKTLGAATILQWGTEEQKQKYLYGLATGRDFWCQLFSEPGSGSDLASLATRAVRDGDVWIVNGQKVWSSGAHMADLGLLLARTDPDQPKHRGITYFILDMHAPGVEVRPLKQMTGSAEFNEVFFKDVAVPDAMRLGPLNEGWRVSTTTLMHERSGLSGARHVGPGHVDRIIEDAKDNGKWNDATMRDRLIKLLTEERALQMTNLRGHSSREAGKPPGPEGSITKLFSSTLSQRIANAAMDVRGLNALVSAEEAIDDRGMYELMTHGGRYTDLMVARSFLGSRSHTIQGGTSEIQRNIIGERVLGLPREPDPWKDRAWKDIPRS